ncbi:PEP-utilizing enzyme [Frankia sp. Cpl3]|nr:PEP-utilizing enzyme [Frankia sp. Cpl3]
MARAGLPVPPFFCLSAAAFTAVVEPLRQEIEGAVRHLDFTDRARLSEQAEVLRQAVLGAPLPTGLADALLRTFEDSFGRDGTVAVRASMVGRAGAGTEDSTDDAFAGISDSFLYVPMGHLLDRVRQCWASGFNADAMLYRHARGDSPTAFAVSVGVQRMALGERSFVLFTCDPQTGLRNPVLAAGLGIGEGVVQERVAVDHFFVDGASGEIRSEVVRKERRMGLGPDGPGAGPVPLPVPERERDLPALSDARIREVLRLGSQVEELFGRPQDIEGTVTADGMVHLLQARPVVLDWDHQRIWSNANITESFSGTTTALTYSFAQYFYEAIFRDVYRRMGVPAASLDRHGDDLAGMIGLFDNRVYYALDSWYRLHRQTPHFALWRRPWERMMGLETSSPDAHHDRLDLSASHLPELASSAARVLGAAVRHARSMERFETWWADAHTRYRATALTDPQPLQLVRQFRALWREVGEQWGVTLLNDVMLTVTAGVAAGRFQSWLPAAEQGLLSDLLCGGEENRSVTILVSAVACAERVRATPGLAEDLEHKPVDEVWETLAAGGYGEDGEDGGDLHRRISRHLDLYGDRGLEELKLEQPNPRTRPAEFLRQLADYARAGMTVDELRGRERRTRAAAERTLAGHLAGRPVQLRALRYLLARQRQYIYFRENSRYCRSELFGLAKETFVALGRALADRGVLDTTDDVFHLTQDEVFGFFDGTGVTGDLRGLVAVRRAESDREQAELPMLFATVGAVRDMLPSPAERGPDGRELRGLGSSGGKVRGVVKLVLDPHQVGAADEGKILVARETDPGWLFLMLSARGIIVERGTMLSHTAITGRRFGIPTIVSLPHATTRIPDGALVEMDGAAGTVVVLEEAG